MKKDTVESQWKEIRDEADVWCGKLTEEDLDWDARRFDVIAGLILEELGQTRRRASEEIDQRMAEYEFKLIGNNESSIQ